MTLCVAWKVKSNVYFASDSRISAGDKYSDYGIKVIPVPVKIFSPSTEGKSAEVAFEATYGMCFAGSFVGAYAVREFLVIALQKLQYAPTIMELSFAQIVRIVQKFYGHILEHISGELDYDHSVDFYFSGYCPKEKKVRTAKFYIDYGDSFDKMTPSIEILEDDEFISYIGTGEEKYRKELQDLNIVNRAISPLEALRRLIQKGEVPSVGGNIQLGSFGNGKEFLVSGIIDNTYQENEQIDKIKYCYAGIDMNGTEFDTDGLDYFIMGTYSDPFNKLES